MPVPIFTETPTRARTFPTLQFSRLLEVPLLSVILRSFTVFGEWAPRWFCMAPAEDNEIFVSAERAYWTVP